MNSQVQNDYRDISMLYGKSPPVRPPPPKYNSRFSVENLNSDYMSDMNNHHFRDRRSVSPTRVSQGFEQRPYNMRHSTSPLPSPINGRSSRELSLSRSGSRNSLNQNYPSRFSRESSPLLTRSPSPMRSSTPFSL